MENLETGNLILGFIVGVSIFYWIAFPLWMFIHCTRSRELNKKAKAFWIVGIVLLGPLVGSFYGILKSKRRLIQWISGGFFPVLVFTVVGILSSLRSLSSLTGM